MIISTVVRISMFVLLLFGRIVFLFPAVCSWSPKTTMLATTTTRLTTRKNTFLLGILSRSEILKHTKKKKKSDNHSNNNITSNYDSKLTRTTTQQLFFLVDAVEEAMHRQTTALEYLDLECKKMAGKLQSVEAVKGNKNENYDIGEKKTIENKSSNINMKIDRVGKRRLEIRYTMKRLNALRLKLIDNKNTNRHQTKNVNETNLSSNVTAMELEFRQIMGSLSSCSILDKPKESWKIYNHRHKQQQREFGRPRGFTGLVLYSPLGVPILVGKRMAHNDNVLRQVAQGSDLWLQVEDYAGSRVLLRTSLMRGMKGSKNCIQMAADIAAKYSILGDNYNDNDLDAIPIMYTDSKHVAKRGAKVGRMRKRKSFGRLLGRPTNVKDITEGLEP